MSDTFERAMPGRENAKDWLTLKIVECLSEPMDERIASKLSAYNSAYNAVCQWSEDQQPQEKEIPRSSDSGFSLEQAKEWMRKLKNEDGTSGPHWTLDQAKQVMSQRGLNYKPSEFWAVFNSIYSDYSKVAKKHNVGNSIDFYVDMVKAFLDDKDSQPDKVARYYKYIVK